MIPKTCGDCNECQDIPGSNLSTCDTMKDMLYDSIGFTVVDIRFHSDTETTCENFDPTGDYERRKAEDDAEYRQRKLDDERERALEDKWEMERDERRMNDE